MEQKGSFLLKKEYYGFPCEDQAERAILTWALRFHFEFRAPIATLKQGIQANQPIFGEESDIEKLSCAFQGLNILSLKIQIFMAIMEKMARQNLKRAPSPSFGTKSISTVPNSNISSTPNTQSACTVHASNTQVSAHTHTQTAHFYKTGTPSLHDLGQAVQE